MQGVPGRTVLDTGGAVTGVRPAAGTPRAPRAGAAGSAGADGAEPPRPAAPLPSRSAASDGPL